MQALTPDTLKTMIYEKDGRVARITLNRPERGNGITARLATELAQCVEWADLDSSIHVIALSGKGKGFCGGYDLVANAENMSESEAREAFETDHLSQSTLTPEVQAKNHNPKNTWDPMIDYQMMSRNVHNFMSLHRANKPVVCKVQGFCVAGGTDMALCSDLLVIAEDAKIGYPPARVWGTPTTSLWVYRLGFEKAKRLLFTGDCLNGKEAVEWGLAIESAPAEKLDERFEILVQRIARMPINQLMMLKLQINQQMSNMGLATTQIVSTVFDGIARHTPEGYAFQQRAAEAGFKQAVHERDDPFGDFGPSTFKG